MRKLTIAVQEVSKDKRNLIAMVRLDMGLPDDIDNAGLMLELIEVDGGMGT
jgi:hypothetical protein